MALTVCSICEQHIVKGTSCVQCTPPSDLAPSATVNLAVPLVLLLGIGCQHQAPKPEVMALYGGPPVEFEPVDQTVDQNQTVDEATESTEIDDNGSTSTEPTKTDSPQDASLDQKSEKISEPKIEVIEHMQALYGVPNIILEPILEEIQEIQEINEENIPEDNDGVDASEDD